MMNTKYKIQHGYWKDEDAIEPTVDYHGDFKTLNEAVDALNKMKTSEGSWQIVEYEREHIASGVYDWGSTDRYWDEIDVEELTK